MELGLEGCSKAVTVSFQITTVTPYATSNKDLPNVNEIVYENNLDQLLEQSSANQLQDSPDIWKVRQFFGNIFEVSATFEPTVELNNDGKLLSGNWEYSLKRPVPNPMNRFQACVYKLVNTSVFQSLSVTRHLLKGFRYSPNNSVFKI